MDIAVCVEGTFRNITLERRIDFLHGGRCKAFQRRTALKCAGSNVAQAASHREARKACASRKGIFIDRIHTVADGDVCDEGLVLKGMGVYRCYGISGLCRVNIIRGYCVRNRNRRVRSVVSMELANQLTGNSHAPEAEVWENQFVLGFGNGFSPLHDEDPAAKGTGIIGAFAVRVRFALRIVSRRHRRGQRHIRRGMIMRKHKRLACQITDIIVFDVFGLLQYAAVVILPVCQRLAFGDLEHGAVTGVIGTDGDAVVHASAPEGQQGGCVGLARDVRNAAGDRQVRACHIPVYGQFPALDVNVGVVDQTGFIHSAADIHLIGVKSTGYKLSGSLRLAVHAQCAVTFIAVVVDPVLYGDRCAVGYNQVHIATEKQHGRKRGIVSACIGDIVVGNIPCIRAVSQNDSHTSFVEVFILIPGQHNGRCRLCLPVLIDVGNLCRFG